MRLTANYRVTAADLEARTITGQVVPFGATGHTSAGPTVVDAAAVTVPDRVPLLVSHDDDRPVGRMTGHQVTEDGITATFRIIGTSAGDSALLEAAEGVRDGLSVGLDVDTSRVDESGALVITAATLREVSLVTFPAFDAARVTDVAATHTDPTPEPVPAESGEDDTQQEEPTVDDTTTPSGGEVVAAALPRITVTAEAFPYGNGDHSMFRDMIAARYDDDAARRVHAAQAMITAAAKSADVADVIPPGYRPDLYVAEQPVPRPFIDAFARYGITDATPFKVPAFGDSANMVRSHVEGTNPAAGTLTVTDVTVTPQAVSGIYDISREALDASNPSLDAIIMTAIREDYAALSEGLCADAIQAGATAKTGPSTTLGIMGAASDFMQARGLPADRILASGDTFTALVTEKDGGNRPMNPFAGAMNADGSVSSAASALSVGGLAVRHAWAATAAFVVARSADAATWESGLRTWRWEEVAGPANIRFAAFGYVAAAVLRPTGVVKVPAVGGTAAK
jgi:HK97 family phage prohead protease